MSNYTYKDFVHLHNHTEYSLQDSCARIKDMVKKAKALGMKSLAITDHGNMFGVFKFVKECEKAEIKPIIGCEVYVTNSETEKVRDNYHLVLLAENDEGYKNLSRIVSEATENVFNARPRATKSLLRKYHDGIIALSACLAGEISSTILSDGLEKASKVLEEYLDIFGKENFYIELQKHFLKEDNPANKGLVSLAKKYGLKMVATNDIHYVEQEDWETQDILYCLKTGSKMSDTNRMHFETKEFYMKSQEEMFKIFKDYEGCLANSAEIAERCNVNFKLKQRYSPKFPKLPEGFTEASYLRHLCEQNLEKFYGNKDMKVARERMDYELSVIEKMGFSGYFLIVWDFIRFAREAGIPIGPGRGSAAGSIVCYLTGITELDPIELDLLFERFLNPERVSMPDIDTDISDERRGEVVNYMIDTYQKDKSAKIITFGSFLAKGAVRDVARILDLPYALGDRISKLIIGKGSPSIDEAMENSEELRKLYEEDASSKRVIDLARKIYGLPKNTGTHAAGIVISQYPLKDILPVIMTDDGIATQFDKDEVEKIGLLKMDLLGLKNLSIIENAKKYILENKGVQVDLRKIPMNDKKATDILKAGDTYGVFQLESEGITDLVKKLSPNDFYDLIPLVALYRPGPLGSGMVNDFVECRHGRKDITYLHPLLEPILKDTFGVILYQEQVMQVVQVLAGFSLGKADIMRRAMGHKEPELLKEQRDAFITGCKEHNNIGEDLSGRIFDLIMKFASYGFNKSHSAAYGYIAYLTAYLKAHYPVEYMASVMTSNLSSKESLSKAVSICKKKGIKVLPVSVEKSKAGFIPEGSDAIRFGLASINGLGVSAVNEMVKERETSPFEGVTDFLARPGVAVSSTIFRTMASVGAFDSLYPRREVLTLYAEQIYNAIKGFKKKFKNQFEKKQEEMQALSLFSDETILEMTVKAPSLFEVLRDAGVAVENLSNIQPFGILETLNAEYDAFGFYATAQPLDYCKPTLEKCDSVVDILEHPEKYANRPVNVCGLKSAIRIIMTKKNDPMAFMSLDVYGDKIECVIFPTAFQKASENDCFNKNIFLLRNARVQTKDGKVQLIANQIQAKDL